LIHLKADNVAGDYAASRFGILTLSSRIFLPLMMKKLCVIGAGAAGLCAIKNAVDFGFDVTAFEQTDGVGGTWVYTDDIGKDKHGLDIHSSMYKGLRTNLPKEIMGYPDEPFPHQYDSYIPSEDVLKYYQSYADKHDLRQFIKFETHVVRVRPLLNDSWEVIVQDMKSMEFKNYSFDNILVCNGHYNTPNWPAIRGQASFLGRQLHSKDYRSADEFRGENVLIVGAGPSGTDCSMEMAKEAKHVTWSHHLKQPSLTKFAKEVAQQPDIAEITKTGAIFADGSYHDFSVIIYCTGYKYSFPFLSVDCEIKNDNNYVRPVYKHCLSINKPTMGFIGLPNYICPNQMCDLQVRFCLTFMTGRKQLPSKSDLLGELKREMKERKDQGLPKSRAHFLGPGIQDEYYAKLADIAGIEPIKPVIGKIFAKGLCNLLHCSDSFRESVFRIVDDENFTIEHKDN
jgi:dimethylaniline monooxygenase (N-oxide forming)